MLFGEFLVLKKLVSEDNVNEALQEQRQRITPMGQCAQERGYITKEQNFEILLQSLEQKRRYGEVAVEMGYIDKTQTDEILGGQKKSPLLLGQILVNKKYLKRIDLTKSLIEFSENYWTSEE